MRCSRAGCSWVSALVAASAIGCWGDSDSPTDAPAATRPFVGREVRVLTPAPVGAAERWSLILSEFENEWGAQAEVVEYDPAVDAATGEQRPRPNSSDHPSGPATLVFFPLADLAGRHFRTPLAEIPRDERDGSEGAGAAGIGWSDLFSGLRNNVCAISGEPAVVPMSAPVLVCYYRRDLLEQAGRKPPETWEDYQGLLEGLLDWAPGLTAVEPWGPEYRATMFLARAVGSARHPGQYSLFFDVETGEPVIDTPGFVRGLEQSLAALALMPAETRAYSPADCRREILAGRAALAIGFETPGDAEAFPIGPTGWTAATSSAGESDGPATARRAESIVLGVTPLPGAKDVYNRSIDGWERPRDGDVNRVPLAGFAGLCAGVTQDADAESRRAAWKLLARLSVQEFGAAFRPEVTSLCRTSQTETPSRWVGEALSGDEALSYVAAVSESLRDSLLVAELPVAGRDRFRAALTEALDAALAGDASAAEALGLAAERWRQIIEEIGPGTVRDSYRASLGLRPVSK